MVETLLEDFEEFTEANTIILVVYMFSAEDMLRPRISLDFEMQVTFAIHLLNLLNLLNLFCRLAGPWELR
jgi:hypothetical protein